MKNMSPIKNERGAAGIKAAIAIAILGAVIYVGFVLIPIYWDHWDFEDKVKTGVQFAHVNWPRDTKKNLEDHIIGLLSKMRAEYKTKDVKVKVEGKKIDVEVWYARSHSLPFLTNPLPFYVKVQNTLL